MSLDNPTIERVGDRFRMVYDEVYPTDIDDLWAAVTTPERLARWMEQYHGDLRLGGSWSAGGSGAEPWVQGTVTACDAPRGFTTTWHALEEEPTELVVRLEPAEGGTRLVLEHDGVQSLGYGAGWQTYLEQLARVLEDPEADLGGEGAWQARFTELDSTYRERFVD